MHVELLAFVALVVTAVVEMWFSGRFVQFYFRYGLPLFVRRVDHAASIIEPVEERLETEFGTGISTPLIFRRLSATEIAFREQAFAWSWFSYTPLMHGLIRLHLDRREIRVIGWANWSALGFIAIWFWLTHFDVEFLVFGGALFSLIYLIQARRYGKVATELSLLRAGGLTPRSS